MRVLSSVEPLRTRERRGATYDAVLAAVGFEQRGTHAARELQFIAPVRVALAFAERQVESFDDNVRWFKAAGYDIDVVAETQAVERVQDLVAGIVDGGVNACSVVVDVSCMSRLRIAAVLAALLEAKGRGDIQVDFVYSLGAWAPAEETSEPVAFAGPVLPCFAGWSRSPELPVAAIVGLGYEPDKAIGAYEFLEASSVWTFTPGGGDRRYDRDIGRGNASLLARVPTGRQFRYRVDHPFACFAQLESVVYGALQVGRPVLVPFGPKIFALVATLVGCIHRDLPVWRISSAQHGKAVNRLAQGPIAGIRAVFASRPEAQEEIDLP